MSRSNNPAKFFNDDEQARIVEAIRKAEKDTSGEVRVHLAGKLKGDALDAAWDCFGKLGMHETAARNGVLVFVAPAARKFAIVADQGINQKVPADFWDKIKDEMAAAFREGKFVEGVVTAVLTAGKALGEYFPHAGDKDENELPDTISSDEDVAEDDPTITNEAKYDEATD